VTDLATATLTSDLGQAKADLAEHGYCLVEGALDEARLTAIKTRLAEQAEAEIADGTDYVYDAGSNQRVWNLLNKGEVFEELAQDPLVCRFMAHLLDSDFLLSNIDANIAGPGGTPMFLHADQSFVPNPWPPYPLVANAMWMLDDFTADNGATRIVPGSHRRGRGPDYGTDDPASETVPVCAPAGTASSPTTAARSCASRRTSSSRCGPRCSIGRRRTFAACWAGSTTSRWG